MIIHQGWLARPPDGVVRGDLAIEGEKIAAIAGCIEPGALAERHGRAAGACTSNYAFHMAIAEWNDRNRSDIATMRETGVSSFKSYLAYDHLRFDDAETLGVLECTRDVGGTLCVHCENGVLVALDGTPTGAQPGYYVAR